MIRRPIAFIATSDPKSAITFYRDTLGLPLSDQSPYALVFQEGPVMLRVQIVEGFEPPGYTVHGWQVNDITAEIARLGLKGITFQTFAHLDQDADGIWSTPAGDKIAWFKDPSGNTLSLTEIT